MPARSRNPVLEGRVCLSYAPRFVGGPIHYREEGMTSAPSCAAWRRRSSRRPLCLHAVPLLISLLALSCGDDSVSPDQTDDSLEVVSPEEVGWSSEKLQAVDDMAADLGYSAMVFARDGKVFHEWGEVTRNYLCHSIRKPFLGALYGIHVARGDIDLDATLEDLGIDDIPPSLTAPEKTATVRQLLQSRSGVYHVAAAETEEMSAARPERGSHAPGTFFYYNNWDFNALGTIFEQETQSGIFGDFATEIAIPLGMEHFAIDSCLYALEPEKSMHPAYSFRMSARDMARFGILFEQQGVWHGKRIIPAAWIEESTQTYSIEDSASGVGYGYMWKTIPEGSAAAEILGFSGYMHTGVGVHALVIVPDLQLVVVQRYDTDGEWEDPGDATVALAQMILDAQL